MPLLEIAEIIQKDCDKQIDKNPGSLDKGPIS